MLVPAVVFPISTRDDTAQLPFGSNKSISNQIFNAVLPNLYRHERSIESAEISTSIRKEKHVSLPYTLPYLATENVVRMYFSMLICIKKRGNKREHNCWRLDIVFTFQVGFSTQLISVALS